jgi:hypothetical protein
MNGRQASPFMCRDSDPNDSIQPWLGLKIDMFDDLSSLAAKD